MMNRAQKTSTGLLLAMATLATPFQANAMSVRQRRQDIPPSPCVSGRSRFDYLDAARMAGLPAARDRTLEYGIYGGTPRYLATIDPAVSLAENVVRSVLSPNGNIRIQTEMDIVARRTDGAMLTGAVKWNTKVMGLSLHEKHTDTLKRLASSGYAWAREALAPGAVLLYVAAGEFVPHFLERAEIEGIRVIAWSLDDIYSDSGEAQTN